jgi:DNA-directed RNA polymerase specialized sigma24 family protein
LAIPRRVREDQALLSVNGSGGEDGMMSGPSHPSQKSLGKPVQGVRIRPARGSEQNLKSLQCHELVKYLLESKDPDAWGELTERIRPCVRGTAANRLRKSNRQPTPDLLDDLEHDAYLKLMANDYRVLRKLQWPDDDAIYRYVKVTATSVTLDWIRKNRIEPEPIDFDKHAFPVACRLGDYAIHRHEIDKCLFTLSEEPRFQRDRAIFWLYYRWRYSAGQIARLPSVNLPVKTVENILLRLKGVVRSRLDAGRAKGTAAN